MECVTHTCGARFYRLETGGVARIVRYYDGFGDQAKELHACPQCGRQIGDRDLTDADGQPIWQPPPGQ